VDFRVEPGEIFGFLGANGAADDDDPTVLDLLRPTGHDHPARPPTADPPADVGLPARGAACMGGCPS
jgi:hypothetical protein